MSNIREMQFGEILDGTFSIYRRHFGLFMKLSMIVLWLPMALWTYLQVRYTGNNAMEFAILFQERPLVVGGVILLMLLILMVASLLMTAGSIRIIADSYLGHEPELGPALRLAAGKIVPLVFVSLGKYLLLALIYIVGVTVFALLVMAANLAGVGVAILVGIVGGVGLAWFLIFVACGYGLTTPAVVLEDLSSSFDSFGRSWDLTRGFKLKLLGLVLVTALIAAFLPGLVVLSLQFVILTAAPSLQPLLVVLASFLKIVLAPVIPCALTLLYYDLRVRREAFDLQILSQQLGIS
jgi:hypothetical protein